MLPVALLASETLAISLAGMAQTVVDRTAHPFIRTTGGARVAAKPDQAKLSIGVVSQASTAQRAAADNATQTAAVIAALRRSLGPGAEIQTSGYSLNPNYDSPTTGSAPTIRGYTASNTVEITTHELENLGKLIDVGAQAGANSVRDLQFALQNEQAVHAQALREATRQARARADAIAAALGLKVVGVLSAEEGEPQVIRPVRAVTMAAPSATTPIEAGEIEVQATVTLTVQVAPSP
jgi:uncharacterized protein YggE